jgi:hypothetical protein
MSTVVPSEGLVEHKIKGCKKTAQCDVCVCVCVCNMLMGMSAFAELLFLSRTETHKFPYLTKLTYFVTGAHPEFFNGGGGGG